MDDKNEEAVNKANDKIKNIIASIAKQGYPHSIVFCARAIPKEESELLSEETKAKAEQIIDGTSFMEGNGELLHTCVTALLSANDHVFGFFASAVEAARQNRIKNNPNIN